MGVSGKVKGIGRPIGVAARLKGFNTIFCYFMLFFVHIAIMVELSND